MGYRELTTVFDTRGGIRKSCLDEIAWSEERVAEFCNLLAQEDTRPESLFLDYFLNQFSMAAADRVNSIIWWREKAPKLAAQEWFLASMGYETCLQKTNPQSLLVIDFFESDLLRKGFLESFAMKKSVLWICWSESLVEDWQQEGMGVAGEKKTKLLAFFQLLGLQPFVVPVVDPIGAALAAKRMLEYPLGQTVLVLPKFGNDKLVYANWRMKTQMKFQVEKQEGNE